MWRFRARPSGSDASCPSRPPTIAVAATQLGRAPAPPAPPPTPSDRRVTMLAVPDRGLCPRLVGREEQLFALEDALLAAHRGESRLVALGGEAGVGKTRLAGE